MADKKPQSFENHSKIVPSYHVLTFGILLINALWSIWRLIQGRDADSLIGLLLAVALIAMFFHLRLFPLTVQDRLIRLEMRLLLREVLPEDLLPRIGELTRGQLVALRFASDEELPGLVREVLDGKLESRAAIKKKIVSWKADHLRC